MDDTQQPDVIAVCVVLVVESTAFVAIRSWSSYMQPNHKFGWDDAFTLLTLVGLTMLYE